MVGIRIQRGRGYGESNGVYTNLAPFGKTFHSNRAIGNRSISMGIAGVAVGFANLVALQFDLTKGPLG